MFRRTVKVLVVVPAALGLMVASTTPAFAGHPRPQPAPQLTRGSFVTLPGGQDLGYSVRGSATMLRLAHWTGVVVRVAGLDPETTYPAHVHNAPCSSTPPGGGHYQDVVGGPVDADNEIWPAVTTNGAGRGRGVATHTHRARPEAMSVVIHYPLDTSIRLACLDLA